MSDFRLDRRGFVSSLAGAGAIMGLPAYARALAVDPVVEIAHGKLCGRLGRGVNVFKGIPYAASTGGGNRFLPPQPVQPWGGLRGAVSPGDSSPQVSRGLSALLPWYSKIETMSEDCLYLNVFAPASHSFKPRPVMVWLHGGGWWISAGTAPGFEGIDLALRGDVVLVTINHRLNLFGHLKVDDVDERFADSGNVGVLDMVAALRWVRQNISVFGGDPGNVTIFGQSGGGSKVTALMTTPLAQGLFHKAIAQSCSGAIKHTEMEEAHANAAAIAAQLNLPKASGDALQAVPMDKLVAALAARDRPFRPLLDGRTFTRHSFYQDAPPTAAKVAFMAGNAANETWHTMESGGHANFDLSIEEAKRRITRFLKVEPGETDRILEAYRDEYPAYSPSDLLVQVTTDYQYIRNTTRGPALQSAASAVPAYAYRFDWNTPVMGGRLRAPHAVEIPFIFGTTGVAGMYVGQGPDLPLMTRMMIATWAGFAHTGNPNNPALPHWPAFDAVKRSTMLLNDKSHVADNPGGQGLAMLDRLPFYEYNMPVNFGRP